MYQIIFNRKSNIKADIATITPPLLLHYIQATIFTCRLFVSTAVQRMSIAGIDNFAPPTEAYTESSDLIEANVILTPELLKRLQMSIGVFGMSTNTAVIIVLLNERSMLRLNTNIYILCQSLVDLLLATTLIITNLIENDGRYFEGTADTLLCLLWLSRIWLFGLVTSSVYNLVVLTVERYLAIVWPVWHKLHVNRKWVVASVAVAWIYGVMFHVVTKVPTARVFEGRCLLYQWPTVAIGRLAGAITVLVMYIGPLTIIFFTYGHMVITLRTRVNPDDASAGMSRAIKNVIRTMVIVTIGLILCLTINQMYFLLFNLGFDLDLQSELFHSAVLLSLVNCTINPFIYLVTYQAYQRALLKLLGRITGGRWKWGIGTEGTTTTTNTTQSTKDTSKSVTKT